jgi:Beta-lactamase superfamily domain
MVDHAMDWTYLGHAGWLATLGGDDGLRIVFDPLLADTHHGDVFEVRPARTIDASALRADFIVISHRHPDHFDVQSLRLLAQQDPDSVVLTSDALVERAARAVGFTTVARVDALHRIELDGAVLLTTPSFGTELEWGVMVATAEGVVYNQVDSVMRNTADVRELMRRAADGLDRPELRQRLDFGLVRWQPLREIQAALADEAGFPTADYADVLEQVAAMNPAAAVPASAGNAHTPRYAGMNHVVYPLDEGRFRRDLAARCPNTQIFAPITGGTYRIAGGSVTQHSDRCGFVELHEPLVPQRFEPYRLPPLVDDDPRSPGELDQRARAWLDETLRPALVAAFPNMGSDRPVVLALDLVGAENRQRLAYVVDAHDARRDDGAAEDYDVLNAIAVSQLVDVIDGRRHWGEPLLAGKIRVSRRAYRVDAHGLQPLRVAPIFLYYALSYADSDERWVNHQLGQLRNDA